MYLPLYGGFRFAIAKNPSPKTAWHHCKEYAGRALGNKNPKKYVTITIFSGYKNNNTINHCLPIANKAKDIENLLNTLSAKFGSKEKFVVSSIDGYDGCLHIRVPTAWCHNRITAHLLLTYIRKELANEIWSDNTHLNSSVALIIYLEKIKLKQFNKEMKILSINCNHRLRGIVEATNRWKLIHNETN